MPRQHDGTAPPNRPKPGEENAGVEVGLGEPGELRGA